MSRSAEQPAAPRPRLSAAERRRGLLRYAREQFTRRGFSAVRTKDIAAAAGVNEALLYQHFGSKQELFDEAILEPLTRAIAALVERSAIPPVEFDSVGDHMRETTTAFVRDLLEAMDEIGPLLGVALYGGSGSPLDAYRELIEPYITTMGEVVEANLGAWPHHPFDPQITTRMTFGAALFITLSAQANGTPVDRDAVAHQIASIFIDALRIRPDSAGEASPADR